MTKLETVEKDGPETLPAALQVPEYEPAGPPYELDAYEKGTWERMNKVLLAYAKCRTKSMSALAAGVGNVNGLRMD